MNDETGLVGLGHERMTSFLTHVPRHKPPALNRLLPRQNRCRYADIHEDMRHQDGDESMFAALTLTMVGYSAGRKDAPALKGDIVVGCAIAKNRVK